MGVGAEDFSFMGVFPEPEAGDERYLLPDGEYRRLFGALAMPGCMETVRYFCRGQESLYVAAAVAEHTGLSPAETEAVLEALTGVNQLVKRRITLPEGPVSAYSMPDDGGIVAFLYYARWLWQGGGRFYLTSNILRERRCFEREGEKDETK